MKSARSGRAARGVPALPIVLLLAGVLAACTNNPYPNADAHRKVFYTSFIEAPKSLDPAVAYDTAAHAVTANIFDTLLEYHYLRRPYTLIPGLAVAVPQPEARDEGRVAYRFRLRDGVRYQYDPCFALGDGDSRTRPVVAADIAFALMRIADPAVNSPVGEPFSQIVGFRAFAARLEDRRKADTTFAALSAHEQYAAVGPIEGLRVDGAHELELLLRAPYPQILYWFAMPFTAPMPWEAVAHYDGNDGRPHLADHPVGAGPYRLARYDKQARIVLERNRNWYGTEHAARPPPGATYPGATYPTEGEPEDHAAGRLDPSIAGKPLPFIERIEFLREKESIPRFNKFLQGYYDASGIIRESFDRVIREDRLSPGMRELDIRLEKAVIPAIYYIGFNMEDPTVGQPAGDRGRRLRQAMSLAVDSQEYARLFLNGRGIPAQSPIPPGIFGHDPDYRNPYRTVDLPRARGLLRAAGYPGGIDPETGKPLHLTFDSSDTTAQGLLRYQFYVKAWRQLGIDVEVAATNYNQFQQKVREGAYQIFMWGWVADYPDPENFLFLLWSKMARSRGGGPNSANFADPEFDRRFVEMKAMPNDARRLALIVEMRQILVEQRPWIELFYPEDYALFHGWLRHVKPAGLSYPTLKYRDIDPDARDRFRRAHNRPVLWPLYALLVLAIIVAIPGVFTFFRERQ